MSWIPWILGVVVAAAAFALFPSVLAFLLGNVVGSKLAFLSTPNRVFGRDAGRPQLLAFLELLDPPVVVMLLALEPDDVTASVLARMQPRFQKKVLALMPALRQESIAYWLDHPQPFPRSEQQAVARRFKRALKQSG